ncbi:Gfo/Idh/MocA family protein [Microbacterium sp. ASV49]|uniref:Gfo/Idh/MocA family oxidoreductase n=1 Tax=Microbacterium candidum TaxID=3041922 RepID=A0ABT7N247_9MICO|nr:Gfo/Idh/MocA family oxidoreductase [Microbacterium sp. ASV49]MDL9980746.1 Gfo/Idh/MocA family oxidoreductase [Microbacterium sp. ASV49]
MTSTPVRVGIAGLGLISRTHATAYLQMGGLVEIAAVCDANRAVAEAFAEEFGGRVADDIDALIADPDIDVIDVILPHFLHIDVATKVLDAGKHLLIEKPVAPNFDGALTIQRKAKEAGVHFMIAENSRYMAAYQAAHRLIEAGEIGDVLHVRTTLRSNEKAHLSDPDNWRCSYDLGGGLVLDTGAHSFYLITWLLGEIESLRGVGKKLLALPNEIEDTAEITGQLRSGAHFSCTFTSISEIPHSERLELYGTRGGILIDQMANPVVKLFRGAHDYEGTVIDEVPFGPDAWHPGGWHFESVLREVTDFITSLIDGVPPLIDNRDAVYALAAVDAAYRSIRTGEPVSMADITRQAL